MNRIEFFRNPVNHLWIAHAIQRVGDVDYKHVYASGRTMDLLKHNISQNICNARAGTYTSYVWDKNASADIDLRFASKEFRQRFVNSKVPPSPRRRARKIDLKDIQDVAFKNPVIGRNAVEISDKKAFVVITDDELIVYEVKEFARYKRFEYAQALIDAFKK